MNVSGLDHDPLRLAVLIPTRARPEDLLRCLRALEGQSRPPDEIVVVARPDDTLTAHALRLATEEGIRIIRVSVDVPGQVAALNAGLDHVRRLGVDVVAITDDDAAPRADWCQRVVEHFTAQPTLAGLGGRDWMHDADGTVDDRSVGDVGRVQWFGRVVGGHPCGVGPPRDVDVLKGANMSFRVSAIDQISFDDRLRGTGAQIFNDFAFSLAVRARGGRVVYDPAVAVDHYPAERHEDHPRSGRSVEAVREAAFNETLMLTGFLGPVRSRVFRAWAVMVGSRLAPGVAHAVRLRLRGRRGSLEVLRAALGARRDARRVGRQQ